MKNYLFITGRNPDLAQSELEIVLGRYQVNFTIKNLTNDFLLVNTEQEIDNAIFNDLGGSVKFGILRNTTKSSTDLENIIANLLVERNFGLSLLGKINRELPLKVKRLARAKRYVFSTGKVLTAAQSKGIKQEFLVFEQNGEFLIFEILAVQNIDLFTLRDRFAPQAHGYRGMLPPKLARIMVNLALENKEQGVIYDPFCGTGRVLMEAILLEQQVLGSDIDEKAVSATKENLSWLVQKLSLQPVDNLDEKIFSSPIADAVDALKSGSIDAIVTEPYLGPPQISRVSTEEQEKIFADLLPIYIDLLHASKALLKPAGSLVLVFPVLNNISLGEKLVDNIHDLGYITTYKYKVSRPNQIVGREIVKIVK